MVGYVYGWLCAWLVMRMVLYHIILGSLILQVAHDWINFRFAFCNVACHDATQFHDFMRVRKSMKGKATKSLDNTKGQKILGRSE